MEGASERPQAVAGEPTSEEADLLDRNTNRAKKIEGRRGGRRELGSEEGGGNESGVEHEGDRGRVGF